MPSFAWQVVILQDFKWYDFILNLHKLYNGTHLTVKNVSSRRSVISLSIMMCLDFSFSVSIFTLQHLYYAEDLCKGEETITELGFYGEFVMFTSVKFCLRKTYFQTYWRCFIHLAGKQLREVILVKFLAF